MPDYVVPKLPNRVIPVTKDCDIRFSMRRKDPDTGDPMDWDGDVYALLDIDKDNPTRVDATVASDLADIDIEKAEANLCKTGTTWRVVFITDSDPAYERPLMVGVFERNDGK